MERFCFFAVDGGVGEGPSAKTSVTLIGLDFFVLHTHTDSQHVGKSCIS